MGDKIEYTAQELDAIKAMTAEGLRLREKSQGNNLYGKFEWQDGRDAPPEDRYGALVDHLMAQYKLKPAEAMEMAKAFMVDDSPQGAGMRDEALQRAGSWKYKPGYADPNGAYMVPVKYSASERTVSNFVLGGVEKAKYGNTTPATQVLLHEQTHRANPYPMASGPLASKNAAAASHNKYGGRLHNPRPSDAGAGVNQILGSTWDRVHGKPPSY